MIRGGFTLSLRGHLVVVALLCVRHAPRWRRKASFAEGVQAGQQFGLPAVEAELTQGTDVQQAQTAFLFRLGLLDRLALRLVFHDDHDIIRFDRLSVFLHCLKAESVSGYHNLLIITIRMTNNKNPDLSRLQHTHACSIMEAFMKV